MSHTIIKSIRITGNSVIITRASNNVYPRTYSTEEARYYSEILQTEGKTAVEKLILKQYFEGNFKGSGKYSFAVFRCLFHEKLERQKEWDKCKEKEYENELLNKFHHYLKNPPKKQPCYIRHINTGGLVQSLTTLLIRFNPKKYRIFSSVDAAQNYLHNSSMKMDDFEVVPISADVSNEPETKQMSSMKRTIKFRGKAIHDDWRYGHYSDFHNPDELVDITYWINNTPVGYHVQVDPDTIGQFTELYDKNKKEIYEGDILKVHIGNGKYELRQVYWWQGSYWTKRIKSYGPYGEELQTLSYYFTNDIKVEVVGNMHDNPELIRTK